MTALPSPGPARGPGPGVLASGGATAAFLPGSRPRAVQEIWIVLGLSLLPSALTAIVAIVDRLTREAALGEQTTTLNSSVSDRWVFDLLYRSIGMLAGMVVVVLALWLLTTPRASGGRRLGLDLRRPGRDLGWGFGLAACIGIPGLGLYVGARAAGLAPHVETNADGIAVSTAIVLLLAALRAALVEEVIVVGYLMTRLRDLGWTPWRIILASALLRGSYHLYQGVAMALGNVAMGLLCAIWFRRTGRVGPLVVAHFILDAVSFLGYALAASWWPGLL